MLTLDRWRSLLATPRTLAFPRLELIGRDHSPPIVVGAGEVRMASPSSFEFTLVGMPDHPGYALTELNRLRENLYDGLARPRLIGVDADGIEWNGGYIIPQVSIHGNTWTFGGKLDDGPFTTDRGVTVSREAGTELIYLLRVSDPMAGAMVRYVRTEAAGGKFCREYAMEILGSRVRFAYEADTLLVTASHSPDLCAPYAENWLGEPLRIMFGQLIFPRLVARNFGDGRASVRVGRCPAVIPGARWAALWEGDDLCDTDMFWSRYRQLLCLIARARDKDGQRNFEAHKITRLYHEIIQASQGTRSVWAMSFATSVEAIVKMLFGKDRVAMDHALRELQGAGIISERQRLAWRKIRHPTAHGELLSPYSNEEEGTALLDTTELMHSLTRELARRSDCVNA
jgi:hypothetical protein